MNELQHVTFAMRTPTVSEFLALRKHARWGLPDEQSAQDALARTLFSVCVETAGLETIGIGRVVGDGAVQLFVTDVIVRRDWRHLGIGSKIMQSLMDYIRSVAAPGAFIGLFAGAGRETFYRRFGFIVRPNDTFGPGMMLAPGEGTTSEHCQPRVALYRHVPRSKLGNPVEIKTARLG